MGRTRAPQFVSGSFGTDLGPAGPVNVSMSYGGRRTNPQDSSYGAPQDESGPCGTDQDLQDESGHQDGLGLQR